MTAWLELWTDHGNELVALEGDHLTVGRSPSSDIALTTDTKVSRLHAVLQQYGSGWSIRDVGSVNGTFVNGRRLVNEQRLSAGDEISLGSTRMVFRTRQTESAGPTDKTTGPPDLTKREREVLVALCRPMLANQAFPQPATVKELAEQFVVSEAAIKFHLSSLYNKFDLVDEGESRRLRLANEAVRRRAVTLADLKSESP